MEKEGSALRRRWTPRLSVTLCGGASIAWRRCLRQNLLVRPGPLVGARAFVGKTGWRGPAGLGPPRVPSSMAGVPAFLESLVPSEEWPTQEAFFQEAASSSRVNQEGKNRVCS